MTQRLQDIATSSVASWIPVAFLAALPFLVGGS